MVKNYTTKTATTVNLYERLATTSTNVFGEKFKEDGIFSQTEMDILRDLEDGLFAHPGMNKVDLVLYLRTDPLTAKERIMKRNRSEEAGISDEVLEQLCRLYDDHLIKKCPHKVITINANKDLDSVLHECIQHVMQEREMLNLQCVPLSPELTPIKMK